MGKNIRYKSGKHHIVGIDWVIMPPMEFLDTSLVVCRQSISQQSSSFVKVLILRADSNIGI